MYWFLICVGKISGISDVKIKKGILVDSQIKVLIRQDKFEDSLNHVEQSAC